MTVRTTREGSHGTGFTIVWNTDRNVGADPVDVLQAVASFMKYHQEYDVSREKLLKTIDTMDQRYADKLVYSTQPHELPKEQS